jgi:cytochrome c oxidase cbb3-type subunit 4
MMNPVWGHLAGAITVLLMLVFIGIWIWAWRKRHRSTFQRMAALPMEDKPDGAAAGAPQPVGPDELGPANEETRR